MASDAWYPDAHDYWVAPGLVGEYPLRYGDICVTPEVTECRTAKGKPWAHVVVLHPSCELGAKATADSQAVVARVHPVEALGRAQRSLVRVGWAERDGRLVIAHANAWWMPPIPNQADDTDWFADFRTTERVPLAALQAGGREGALTHAARVHLIRREIYYRYRWVISLGDVRTLEAERIAGDSAFVGPRPEWAI